MNLFVCFIWFLLRISTTVLGQVYVNEDPTPERANVIGDVYLRYYNGTSVTQFVQFPMSQAIEIFNVVGFKPNNPTVFYAHGFNENPNKDSVKNISQAYLDTKPDINFVLIDWSNMAGGNYLLNSAPNTTPVGLAAAVQINVLVENGLPLDTIHLIGHSLGAHVVGNTARKLKNTYQKTIRRVTGIDPAFPMFYPDGLVTHHLEASDAAFVDVIHTDAGGYGAPVRTGTVDFWPNDGTAIQPGCTLEIPLTSGSFCSHGRSWKFYAESVRTPTAFPAIPASSYLSFKLKNSSTVGMIYMGYGCTNNASGNFYLTTNSASPYGKGLDGLN